MLVSSHLYNFNKNDLKQFLTQITHKNDKGKQLLSLERHIVSLELLKNAMLWGGGGEVVGFIIACSPEL
jgi:uncharacterized SAM-dependent methyltransferase